MVNEIRCKNKKCKNHYASLYCGLVYPEFDENGTCISKQEG